MPKRILYIFIGLSIISSFVYSHRTLKELCPPDYDKDNHPNPSVYLWGQCATMPNALRLWYTRELGYIWRVNPNERGGAMHVLDNIWASESAREWLQHQARPQDLLTVYYGYRYFLPDDFSNGPLARLLAKKALHIPNEPSSHVDETELPRDLRHLKQLQTDLRAEAHALEVERRLLQCRYLFSSVSRNTPSSHGSLDGEEYTFRDTPESARRKKEAHERAQLLIEATGFEIQRNTADAHRVMAIISQGEEELGVALQRVQALKDGINLQAGGGKRSERTQHHSQIEAETEGFEFLEDSGGKRESIVTIEGQDFVAVR